ncbi:hypothetical protein [Limnovirga soli]|uniref:Uncharacterized protein n=1 Tax=Limnovirga soli TaxID=2656915 RepID=A0A8J8FCX5_9BACT|nr:hypothetical protein [Limnovirga soli]NNV54278.1 hypothetical protein [Limnovirga soli]
MKRTSNLLPDWIASQFKNQLQYGAIKPTDDNAFSYFLFTCVPQIFEAYAIVLHPFWINWDAKEKVDAGVVIAEYEMDDNDFKSLTWQAFFSLNKKNFELSTAYKTHIEINKELLLKPWPDYFWFPGSGDCETEALQYILSEIKNLYGDLLINCYFELIKTVKIETDIIYRGLITTFGDLPNKTDIKNTPSVIYPDCKEWIIVSDYDLPFTFIGGTKELINRIIQKKELDIFEIIQTF